MKNDIQGSNKTSVKLTNEDINKVTRGSEDEQFISLLVGIGNATLNEEKERYLTRIKELLENKKHRININIHVDKKTTPLLHAIEINNIELVKLLVAHGAKTKEQSKKHTSPIKLACLAGNREIVKILLDKGANLSTDIINQLLESNDEKHLKVIELLVNNKKIEDTDLLKEIWKKIAINFETDALGILINDGIDINLKNDHEETLLTLAIKENKGGITEFLVNSGANIEYPALDYPLKANNLKILQILLNKMNNIWLNENNILIRYITMNINNIKNDNELFKVLLEHKDIPDANQDTSLMYALKNNQLEEAKILIKNDAALSLTNAENKTAFDIALEKENIDLDLLNDSLYEGWRLSDYVTNEKLSNILWGNYKNDTIMDHYIGNRLNLYNIARATKPINRNLHFFPVSMIITTAVLSCISIWIHVLRDHFFAASFLNMIPSPFLLLIPIIPVILYCLFKGIRIGIDNYNNNAAKSYCKEKGFQVIYSIKQKIDKVGPEIIPKVVPEVQEVTSMHFEDKYYQETQHEISSNDSDNEERRKENEKILMELGIN